jgi:hypothetical protein
VSAVVAKEDYRGGVMTMNGEASQTSDDIDKGTLLGFKIHMNAPTAFTV